MSVITESTNQVKIILAIGPRPILDIPNRIEIPITAVTISSSKTILVRNLGDAPAIFNFSIDKYVSYNSSFKIFSAKFNQLGL